MAVGEDVCRVAVQYDRALGGQVVESDVYLVLARRGRVDAPVDVAGMLRFAAGPAIGIAMPPPCAGLAVVDQVQCPGIGPADSPSVGPGTRMEERRLG